MPSDGRLYDKWINDETRLNATNMNTMLQQINQNTAHISAEAANRVEMDKQIRNFNAGWRLHEDFERFLTEHNLYDEKTVGTPEIFNDYVNNKAYTPYASVHGTNSIAGWKGYPVLETGYTNGGSAYAYIILEDRDQDAGNRAVDVYRDEDVVNLDGKLHYHEKLKIDNIDTISQDFSPTLGSEIVEKYLGHTIVIVTSTSGGDIPQEYIQLDENTIENWMWSTEKCVGIPIECKVAPVVFGFKNRSYGAGAFSAGRDNVSLGDYASTFGRDNRAGYAALSAGFNNRAIGFYSFTAGSDNTASGHFSAALGDRTNAIGSNSFAMGQNTFANGQASAAFGVSSITGPKAYAAVAFGLASQANGSSSIAMGETCIADGNYAVAIGYQSHAKNPNSIALGFAKAEASHAVAIGNGAVASGYMSFSLGSCTADGDRAVAIGTGNTSSGYASFAAGDSCTASGSRAFALGRNCSAGFNYNVVTGCHNTATAANQTIMGKYALTEGKTDLLFAIGNGESGARSNAFSVFTNGDAEIKNDLTVLNNATISNKLSANNIEVKGQITVDRNAEQDNELVTLGQFREEVTSSIHYRGVTETPLEDGCTTNPIIINEKEYSAKTGDVVIDDNDGSAGKGQEWIFDGKYWRAYGDVSDYVLSSTFNGSVQELRNEDANIKADVDNLVKHLAEDPVVTYPKVIIDTTSYASEVGRRMNYPSSRVKIDSVGSYSYGPNDTGIYFPIGAVSISCEQYGTSVTNDQDMKTGDYIEITKEGTFEYVDGISTYTFSVDAAYVTDPDNVPVNNLGVKVEEKRIGYGKESYTPDGKQTPIDVENISDITISVVGYRNWFVAVNSEIKELNSVNIRQDDENNKSNTAQGNATTDYTDVKINIPKGTKQIVIAIPKNDGNKITGYKTLQSVVDTNFNQQLKGDFSKTQVSVCGANTSHPIEYDVWVKENSSGLDATTYSINVGN